MRPSRALRGAGDGPGRIHGPCPSCLQVGCGGIYGVGLRPSLSGGGPKALFSNWNFRRPEVGRVFYYYEIQFFISLAQIGAPAFLDLILLNHSKFVK
jgi:hypothetical protein